MMWFLECFASTAKTRNQFFYAQFFSITLIYLIKLLTDEDSQVRRIAAETLRKLGKDSDEVVNPLIKLLTDEYSEVRYIAAETLRK